MFIDISFPNFFILLINKDFLENDINRPLTLDLYRQPSYPVIYNRTLVTLGINGQQTASSLSQIYIRYMTLTRGILVWPSFLNKAL